MDKDESFDDRAERGIKLYKPRKQTPILLS